MGDLELLTSVSERGRAAVAASEDGDLGLEEFRELARWMLYSLWSTDPDGPPWYGTPEELEYFRTNPNPLDEPEGTA